MSTLTECILDAQEQFYLLDYQVVQGVEELAAVSFAEEVRALVLGIIARQSNQRCTPGKVTMSYALRHFATRHQHKLAQTVVQTLWLCQQMQGFPDHAFNSMPTDLEPRERLFTHDTVRSS